MLHPRVTSRARIGAYDVAEPEVGAGLPIGVGYVVPVTNVAAGIGYVKADKQVNLGDCDFQRRGHTPRFYLAGQLLSQYKRLQISHNTRTKIG